MNLLLHFVLTVFVVGAYGEQVCRVERQNDVGLAEYREGAMNLRADYDTRSADECFQRCCDYKDDAGNHCNAVSYYDVDGEYAICLLLRCFPLDSCVWMSATNFTAALVLLDIAEEYAVNQSEAWNQSTVTSPSASAPISTPSVSPDLQDWNVINGEVPSQVAVPVPNPDSAAVPDGTLLSNNGSSNGTLPEGTAQDAWNVLGLDPGNANSTSDDFTDHGLTDNSTIPDTDNDWNVVDTGILSDNQQPKNSVDNGQQQQQQQPVVNPFDEGPKDEWNDGLQDGDKDFWSIFGADDQFWSDEDDYSQSNVTVAGTEAGNDLEQPFNQPEQPANQPEQPVNQPEQPQQAFDDVRVTEDNGDDWQMENEETPPHDDDTEPVVRRIPIPSLGIIIGLCSALGVAFLVLIAVCRKVYHGQEWPKYKPLRSDYDMRNEPSSSSSALLP